MGCGSCGEKAKVSKYVCSKCGKEEIREVKEEVRSCCGQNMIKKEEYIDKLATQLKEWNAKINLLKDKAAKGTADIKIAINKDVEVLNKKMKDAQVNLHELKGKSGDAWKVFAEGAGKSWNDLREAVRQAGEKFK
ncbi:MAG: coiled coil domain-containing protein [Candidatus Omnitrophota bacterium]|nr:coiled coil domain-containing protein [Candidatus Omnitrophota bacterium]